MNSCQPQIASSRSLTWNWCDHFRATFYASTKSLSKSRQIAYCDFASRKSWTAILAAFIWIVLSSAPLAHCSPTDNEYAVKAAFLFHFAQMTEWPPEALRASDPMTFCTIGKDPFGGSMEGVLAGKSIRNRPIRILHLKAPADIRACQVLFIGVEESDYISNLLNAVHDMPVLTVGETAGFIEQGGMIGFRSDDDRLRFEINLSASEKCRLKLSSVLLSLAKTIIGKKR